MDAGTNMKCKARQYSDQKVCHDCRLVWDASDTDLPKGRACAVSEEQVPTEIQQAYFADLKGKLKDETINSDSTLWHRGGQQ